MLELVLVGTMRHPHEYPMNNHLASMKAMVDITQKQPAAFPVHHARSLWLLPAEIRDPPSLPWKDTMLLIGKPSISIRAIEKPWRSVK